MTITIAPTRIPDLDEPALPADQVFKTIQISHPDDHLAADKLLDLLIKPALIAWGFNPTTVARVVFDEESNVDPY